MTDFYEIILELIKRHPIRFRILLMFTLLSLLSVIFTIIIRKKRIEKNKSNRFLNFGTENKKSDKKRYEKFESHRVQNIEKKQNKNILNTTKEVSVSSTNSTEVIEIDKPIYNSKIRNSEIPKAKNHSKLKVKTIERTNEEITENDTQDAAEFLFVNYHLPHPECFKKYPVLRVPKKGCIVRSHRFGRSKRRGYKEEAFQKSIQKFFGKQFIVSGEVRLNTRDNTRPFEPDIAIIDKNKKFNIRIDVEIDEPYEGKSRQPIHCYGEDTSRDDFFVCRGWIVIRFSEFQVHTQEMECLKYLAFIIRSISSNYTFSNELNPPINLKTEKLWDSLQARQWEKEKYREQYLEHEFGIISETIETEERSLNEQELLEEKLVHEDYIEFKHKTETNNYNEVNAHPRDKRIEFFSDSHSYKIDGNPAFNVSDIISDFFPKFNRHSKASNLSPSNRLYGRPVKEIINEWDKQSDNAINKGKYLHQQIEKFFIYQSYDNTKEFKLFQQFVADHPNLCPYRTEWRIFDEKYKIAGTIDLIVSTKEGFEIYDWKRSKNVVDFWGNPIIKNNWKCYGIGKLSNIHDTSYNRYCLQLSLYKYILEQNYDIKISKTFIVVLHPKYDQYYKINTPYLQEETNYIVSCLKDKLQLKY